MKALHKVIASVAVVGIVGLGLTGCWPDADKPVFAVGGGCTPKSGTLSGFGSGFDANTTYKTTVTRPNDDKYPESGYHAYNVTTEDGTIINWPWSCKGKKAGTYSVTISELGKDKTASAKFTISDDD